MQVFDMIIPSMDNEEQKLDFELDLQGWYEYQDGLLELNRRWYQHVDSEPSRTHPG
jgi:hypothetical protein